MKQNDVLEGDSNVVVEISFDLISSISSKGVVSRLRQFIAYRHFQRPFFCPFRSTIYFFPL